MAQDEFGNYIADIWPTPVATLPRSMHGGSYGDGPPSDSNGENGDTYVNLNDGVLWTKSGGTWSVATGPVGPAGGSGLYGATDPEGVVVANRGTTYYNTVSGAFWVKKTGDGTNTLWIPIVT